MKDEDLIDKLDKCIVYIEDNKLYTINKHHTLMMRFELNNKYPKMCFATSKWIKKADFYIDKNGAYKIRDKTIVLKKEGKVITIPQLTFDLKAEWDDLNKIKNDKIFEIDKKFYETINEYSDASSFCKIELKPNSRKLSLYDTSKDRTVEYSTRLLIPQTISGKWFLPTAEINTLHILGYNHSDVFGEEDGDYIHVHENNMDAIVSSMYITK